MAAVPALHPNQPSPVEAFLAIRSPILSRSRIQQVRKTLGSFQNQNQNQNKQKKFTGKTSNEAGSFRWSPGQLGWMVATSAWKTRSPSQLQDKMCVFSSDGPCSVLRSRGRSLVFFASYGQERRGAVTCQAPGSNCAGGSLLSPEAGECLAAKGG